MEISAEMNEKALVKLPNWKATGPDAVQGFWIKNLTNLHSKLVDHLNECLVTEHFPAWMTTGRTVPIQKNVNKGKHQENINQSPAYQLFEKSSSLYYLVKCTDIWRGVIYWVMNKRDAEEDTVERKTILCLIN